MIANTIAEVITNPKAKPETRRLARELVRELLQRPFSTAEAAEKLGVSKPTAIKWLRAGLVRRAEGSSRDENLFDVASVLTAREILRQLKAVGSVDDRARLLAGLPEQIYWENNREALVELRKSLQESQHGRVVEVSDDELGRGRALLAKRKARRQLRRRSRPRLATA